MNERGGVSILMIVALSIGLSAGFGVWGYLRHWRHLAELQLKLDRCVAEKALELRDIQATLVSSNREIRMIRLAMIPATLLPQARAAAQAALSLEVLRQNTHLLRWKVSQGLWLARNGCGFKRDLRVPIPTLPSLDWIRDPPDPLGARPLRWIGTEPEETYRIRLSSSPRAAQAWVYSEGGASHGEWKTSWTKP